MKLLHATCIAIGQFGVLLRGPSGSGKSDLALRLIDEGAILVADDQVYLKSIDGELLASSHNKIAGKIEIRGCGIFDFPFLKAIAIKLIIDLEERNNIPRLPETDSCNIFGHRLPLYRLYAFDISSPIKIRTLLNNLVK
ncbi:MAG: aldolase [Rhodospirillaceae bacterium]|nr:aldolase [Rhodospirillaceae bacterium]|tara:strand:- start:1079 stop:1495 length:417 start_codon:yes stop_codon:yes gene_type:complete